MYYTSKISMDSELALVEELIIASLAQLETDPGRNDGNALLQLYRCGMVRELCTYVLDYPALSGRDCYLLRQIQALFQKCDSPRIPSKLEVLEKECVDKWMESETRCRDTNKRLRTDVPNRGVRDVLHIAARKIHQILGPLPSLSCFPFAFGPGATTTTTSVRACAKHKISDPLACSRELAPGIGPFLSEVPMLLLAHCDALNSAHIAIAPGKLVTVAKTSFARRAIVVEPSLNTLFQKGVGSYIKDRFKRSTGIDLRTQEDNRTLARKASVHDHLVTVDLSSASDTIAYNVIADLFPHMWYLLLSRLRTGLVEVPGVGLVDQEKFCSMGNGYTWDVEAVLFYSLAYACCKALKLPCDDVRAFGDDIIIPCSAYSLLLEVLTWLGFVVNVDKTFSSGPFRESCGSDWLSGIDVRPVYVRHRLTNADLMVLHNELLRKQEPALAKLVIPHITCKLLWGPDGFGDGHLVGGWAPSRPRRLVRRGYEGALFSTYTLRTRRDRSTPHGMWVVASYSVYTRAGAQSPYDPDVVRGSGGWAVADIYTLHRGIFVP